MNLPEIKSLDFAAPIQTYYAAKQQGEQNALKTQALNQEAQMNQMKLSEYKDQAPARALDMKVKKMLADEQFTKWGQQSLASVDPEAPDFDQQIFSQMHTLETQMVTKYGFTPQESEQMVKGMMAQGITSREGVMKMQIDKGLREAPKQQVDAATGQLVTITGGTPMKPGTATAEAIPGFKKKPLAESPLGKLMEEMKLTRPGSPERALYEQAVAKEVTRSKAGESIRMNPDGSVEILRGDAIGDDNGLGKAAEGKIQTKMLDASGALSRLSEIKKSYNDTAQNYLTAGGKARLAKIDLMAKSGVNIPEEDKVFTQQATGFASKAMANLNITLNELSGAAVTQHEYERISQTLPDPGKKGIINILSGDNSIEFQTKLSEAIRVQQMALARLSFINNNGFTIGKNRKGEITGFFDDKGSKINLDDMPKIMKERANAIAGEMLKKNPDMSRAELAPAVQSAISQEFGLVVGGEKPQQPQLSPNAPIQLHGDITQPQPIPGTY